MNDWIPFEEGDYIIEQAFLVAPDNSAAVVENGVLRIHMGRGGKKYVNGEGLVQNLLLIELLEVSDDVDLLIDMGQEYRYLLETPFLKAGKVFSPDVKSMLQFSPEKPWQPLSTDEFENMTAQLKILS